MIIILLTVKGLIIFGVIVIVFLDAYNPLTVTNPIISVINVSMSLDAYNSAYSS